MKYILVIGSGGREHAIVRALTRKKINITPNNSPRELNTQLNTEEYQIMVFGTHLNPGIDRLINSECDLIQINNFYQILDINDPLKISQAIQTLPESQKPNWAIIGPEKPLANGVVDVLESLKIPCIGPNEALSKLECSKIYGRKLMTQDSLLKKYVPRHRIFEGDYKELRDKILESFEEFNFRFVVKPSQLSGGKGVKIFKDCLDDFTDALEFCSQILNTKNDKPTLTETSSETSIIKSPNGLIIEEYLEGEEISLMSLSDEDPEHPLLHFPPVQDHKKAYDFDQGPNTGGMGTLSLASNSLPFLSEKDLRLIRRLNSRMMKCLPKKYQGIIFGGYLKTKTGHIKILEYNVRFGDPESINILETLKYPSLIDLCEASLKNELTLDLTNKVQFSHKHCLVHYLVPLTYPNSRKEMPTDQLLNLDRLSKKQIKDNLIFASVKYLGTSDPYNKSIRMAGHSRTLAVCVQDEDYFNLLKKGRELLHLIQGELRYRFDIGNKFVSYFQKNNPINRKQINIQLEPFTYGSVGVNVNEAERSINLIKKYVEKTYTDNVFRNFGGFGGLFRIPITKNMNDPILTTSIDGTGTKSKFLPRVMNRADALYNLGRDVFFANLNDIIVTARNVTPLFFLDYFSTHTLDAEDLQYYVQGISDACQETETSLIGGETAELKTHQPNSIELVGCLVGQIKNDSAQSIYVKEMIKENHHVLGIKSNGLHTNGYTLINRLMDDDLLTKNHIKKYQKELCGNHRNYHPFLKHFTQAQLYPSGLCHITGGGLIDNPKRVLPNNLKIKWNSHIINEMPPFYKMLQSITQVNNDEMFQTYNMGYGFLIFCDPKDTLKYLEMYPDDIRLIGEVKKKKYRIKKVNQ